MDFVLVVVFVLVPYKILISRTSTRRNRKGVTAATATPFDLERDGY